MKRFTSLFVAVAIALAALFFIAPTAPALATGGGGDCVPQDAWTETIEHPAETHVVHHPAVTHEETTTVVDKEAWTEVIPGTPDLWWNWSPNHHQGPFNGPPNFPNDSRGTWQGPHENGGPQQNTYGTFQTGGGHSPWFHREKGAAEQTINHPAETHEETITVVDEEAYDETVVDKEAWTETVEHPAKTCPPEQPEPKTTETSDENLTCDGYFTRTGSFVTEYVLVEGHWVLGEPGETTWGEWTKQRDLTYEEKVELECATPQPEPVVASTSSTSYECGHAYAVVNWTQSVTEYVTADGGVTWTLGQPVVTTGSQNLDHVYESCPKMPWTPVDEPKKNAPKKQDKVVAAAALPNTGGPNMIALGGALALLIAGIVTVTLSRRKATA